MTPALAPLLALALATGTEPAADAAQPDPPAALGTTALAPAEAAGLAALPLPPLDPAVLDGLAGPRSRTASEQGGLLVETWTDGTGRPSPLVVRYRLVDGKLAVDSVERAPRFPTSFDCGRATKDVERVVCALEPLAALDVALARAFQAALARTAPARRVVVRDAQARWLAERDARCGAAQGFAPCLEAAYRERLAELGAAAP